MRDLIIKNKHLGSHPDIMAQIHTGLKQQLSVLLNLAPTQPRQTPVSTRRCQKQNFHPSEGTGDNFSTGEDEKAIACVLYM